MRRPSSDRTDPLPSSGHERWHRRSANRSPAQCSSLLPLFALLGVILYWMLPGHGCASRVSRAALLAYIVFYPAFDASVGLGSGTLLQSWRGLTAVEQATLEPAIMRFFFEPSSPVFWVAVAASLAWSVGAIAVAIALWRPAGWQVGLSLLVAGLAMTVDHIPPFGPLTGMLVAIAAWRFLAGATMGARAHTAR